MYSSLKKNVFKKMFSWCGLVEAGIGLCILSICYYPSTKNKQTNVFINTCLFLLVNSLSVFLSKPTATFFLTNVVHVQCILA